MTEDEKPVITDEHNFDQDWIDRVVGDFGLINDDFDLETAAQSLTAEDRKALSTARGPAQLLARIVAGSKAHMAQLHMAQLHMAQLQSTQPTERIIEATTDTRSDAPTESQPRSPEDSHKRNELLRHLEECHQLDDLNLRCDYRKNEIIGRGGQGIVFKTESNEYNLIKALKVFTPEPYDDVDSYYDDMDRMADVARLVYHTQSDNLVTIEQFTFREGIFLMIMRWVDGYDLASLLQPSLLDRVHALVDPKRRKHLTNVVVAKGSSQSRLTPGVAVYIIVKCLRALDALHNQDIVHGDIKPANIMLDRYGSIRLVDIGSAFQLSTPPSRHNWTPLYAPPETFGGGQWTKQSDLTSLGYVLIELLSGQPAVTPPETGSHSTRRICTKSDQQLLEEKRRLPERLEKLLPADVRQSADLMGFLRRLIDPDPSHRFVSADDALVGPGGTFQFLQGLSKLDLFAPFTKEIREWLTDARAARA